MKKEIFRNSPILSYNGASAIIKASLSVVWLSQSGDENERDRPDRISRRGLQVRPNAPNLLGIQEGKMTRNFAISIFFNALLLLRLLAVEAKVTILFEGTTNSGGRDDSHWCARKVCSNVQEHTTLRR